MADSDVKIVVGVNVEESAKNIIADLKNKVLPIVNSANAFNIKVGIDNASAKNISSQVQNITNSIKVKSNVNIADQIFDAEKLKATGRKYFSKTTDILDQVKNYYRKNGALSVDISSIEKANGQIRSFKATVTDATNVVKELNFERGKISINGREPNYGFVQSNSLKSIDKNAGANYKETLNYLNRIDQKIMTIQSRSTRQSNPLKEDTQFYDNYNNKLTETVSKIDAIRSANKTLSTEQRNEIDILVKSLDLYAKEQQKLAYPPVIGSTGISTQVEKETSNLKVLEARWKNQGLLTDEVKAKVDRLKISLSKVGDTESLKKYRAELTAVSNEVGFNKQVQGAEKLALKVKNLTTQIKAYQQLNQKAMSAKGTNADGLTYKQELDGMLVSLKNCSDPTEYNKIATNFRTIKTEITGMGLQGNTILGDLWANIKKFSSWMGMTAIISSFARSVNNAINELKEVDTILTEISKTSDRTAESLKRLGEEAFDAANKYGATVTGYLTGVQEMSRAGFGESQSEKLAELSILAQSAGDMTADLSNQYLIATNAAYKFDGSTEKLNATLD